VAFVETVKIVIIIGTWRKN